MRYLILGLLLSEPRSLYEVHARFSAGLSHIYAASFGSIHRALRQLLADGDVALAEGGDTSRNKKHYLATAQGWRTWAGWMRELQPGEDAEATMLARVFLLGLLDDADDQREVLVALHRRALACLHELRSVAAEVELRVSDDPDARRTGHYPRAALTHGLRASEHAVTWLEDLLAELPATPASRAGAGAR